MVNSNIKVYWWNEYFFEALDAFGVIFFSNTFGIWKPHAAQNFQKRKYC